MNEPNDSGNMKDIPKGFAERFVELNNNIDNIQAKSVSELYGTERTKNKTNLEKEGGSKLMQCKIQITAYNDLTKFVDSKGEDMFLPTIIKTGNVIPSDIQNMMSEFMHWLSEDNFLYLNLFFFRAWLRRYPTNLSSCSSNIQGSSNLKRNKQFLFLQILENLNRGLHLHL